jgi:uncharacterized Fe-S cluster-containing radical SAM superfamily protein
MIYITKGKAREYGMLALNIYNGCDHGCTYCYLNKIFKGYETWQPEPKESILEAVQRESARVRGRQVFLSFAGDPYCHRDVDTQMTREVLKILLKNKVPVAILTKGGMRVMRDIDIFQEFGENIKVGMTITGVDRAEPNAATNSERYKALTQLVSKNIKTWVSIEPAPEITKLNDIVVITYPHVDHIMIGKANYVNDPVNWQKTGHMLISTLDKHKVRAYIKKGTQALIKGGIPKEYADPRKFDLTGWKGDIQSQGTLF